MALPEVLPLAIFFANSSMTMEAISSLAYSLGTLRLQLGKPFPLGATLLPEGGINFSVFSAHATRCTLVLFCSGETTVNPVLEIPFPQEFRRGYLFTMSVLGLNPEELEYGFRMEGPWDPREGHFFDSQNILLDPEARIISGNAVWCRGGRVERKFSPLRARLPLEPFNWQGDSLLHFASNELVIYEMHVRGFTRHDSSGVGAEAAGTFEGMKAKIPYLKELGVNCVELMPIFEFDEWDNDYINPLTGNPLCNYWGYSSVGFNAPKASFAMSGRENGQVSELKSLIRALHEAGIQVFLDVVFNHTAESEKRIFSFRGIDCRTYYLSENSEEGWCDANYSGCGNTLNCGHPIVRNFILSCLRHWVLEYHIDGFRFDLASILGRDTTGSCLANPPLLEELAYDPLLAACTLIAEPWDASGLYQVGSFPSYGKWKEWNGKYRDCARRFLKGELGVVGEMVQRIMGSPDLYAATSRGPTASINFITCHDGFTLADLFSYNEKRNLENGENNQDGSQENYSWNCGIEGEAEEEEVRLIRMRLQKNAIVLLFISQGIPMIYMGDECGRSQRGNNNAYCHDEPWNWLDWSLLQKNSELLRFVRSMIAFRKTHPSVRRKEFLSGKDTLASGYPDISWHGVTPWRPDWSDSSQSLAFLLCGYHACAAVAPEEKERPEDFVYCAFNSFYNPLIFEMPALPEGMQWHQFVNTGLPATADICDEVGKEQLLNDQKHISLMERSCVVLIGK